MALTTTTISCLPDCEQTILVTPSAVPTPMDDIRTNGEDAAVASKGPDPDAIKMFVGQVPRCWTEGELKSLFDEYGSVYQLSILRDKATGLSRGCCFVTFHHRKDAIAAQGALHNVKVLPGMHHPVQMKPADSENRNERKLFIGMISKKLNEQDVKAMFTQFGIIEDCTILRDAAGNSKGCAFVTFTSRASALNAIKAMHHSKTMEGCTVPIVVKFADTQKDKDQKKTGGTGSQVSSMTGGVLSFGAVNPTAQSPVLRHSTLSTGPAAAAAAALPSYLNLLQNINGLNQNSSTQHVAVQNAALVNRQNAAQLGALASYYGFNSQLPSANVPTTTVTGAAALINAILSAAVNGSTAYKAAGLSSAASMTPTLSNNLIQLTGGAANALSQQYSAYQLASAATVANPLTAIPASKQVEGPEGANLFIYHLPQEFSDSDLAQTFMPFGNILSAKVFVDKQTNMSKCFGFVSYESAPSALAAIQAMNGFQIGTKRLKVQLKRSKHDGKPYQHPQHSNLTSIHIKTE